MKIFTSTLNDGTNYSLHLNSEFNVGIKKSLKYKKFDFLMFYCLWLILPSPLSFPFQINKDSQLLSVTLTFWNVFFVVDYRHEGCYKESRQYIT